jgi:hypothetical protein
MPPECLPTPLSPSGRPVTPSGALASLGQRKSRFPPALRAAQGSLPSVATNDIRCHSRMRGPGPWFTRNDSWKQHAPPHNLSSRTGVEGSRSVPADRGTWPNDQYKESAGSTWVSPASPVQRLGVMACDRRVVSRASGHERRSVSQWDPQAGKSSKLSRKSETEEK